jgi:pimeloyl-ACP methyl ester carboxylesterase
MRALLLFTLCAIWNVCDLCAQTGPSNFTEIAMNLQTSTGEIGGTLLLPAKVEKAPVALIIAGSGPTDRNGNNPMANNESLRLLAHALGEKGIASLRYDKRGIGESTSAGKMEKDLRFDDYVNDAGQWVSLLKKDKRFSRVVVIGHSEGSLIGMLAARKGASAFVSLAGAGRNAADLLKEQLNSQPPVIRDTCYAIIDSLQSGRTVARVNPMLFALFRPSVQPYMISWFRYDPQVEIRKLSIPVLLVQGTKDLQVTTRDFDLLRAAKAGAGYLLVEDMNHVLRLIKGDRNENMASYNDGSLPLAAGVPEAVIDFIHRKPVKARKAEPKKKVTKAA